jgi:flagellum-specific peptidoglycan hydrolase FlgJ
MKILLCFATFSLSFFAQASAQKSSGSKAKVIKPVTTAISLSSPMREVAQVVADSFGSTLYTVEAFMKEALILEKDQKIPATFFIGLAILESAGFNSHLYRNAKNPFGMKATKDWKGKKFMMWHEGQNTAFRQYETPKAAVEDFAKFLRGRKWYRDALTCPSRDYDCFLEGLKANPEKKEPGYARDPGWADKIRRVIKQYNLEVLKP